MVTSAKHGASQQALTLYFAPGSSSMAPHIALYEVGAEFEARPISFATDEQKQPEYLQINPEGKVPVLMIGERPMTEVAGILFYIAQRFPEAGLLPDSSEDVAWAVSWMSYVAATIQSARSRGPEFASPAFAVAEQRLGGRPWVVGERLSIADIHLFRLFWRFKRGDEEPASHFPGLLDHWERMMARPAVQNVIEVESALGYHLKR